MFLEVSCPARATHSLPSLAILATDLPAKTLHLRYDPEQLSMEQIKTALGQAEYPIEKELPLVE
jgi:hypothetical protein